MLLSGIVMWLELRRIAERRRDLRAHPLSDPLEGAEWQGLTFVLPLLGWLSGRHKKGPR